MDKNIFSRAKIQINSETNDMHVTIDGKILTEWEEKKTLDYIFEDINQRKFEERFGKKKTKGKGGRKPDPNKEIKQNFIRFYYSQYTRNDIGEQTKVDASRFIHKKLKINKPKEWEGNIYAPNTIRNFLKKLK